MFDRIMLFLGSASSAIGVALQGVGIASGHPLGTQIAAIVCSGVGAGCLACSPSIRGGMSGQSTPTQK